MTTQPLPAAVLAFARADDRLQSCPPDTGYARRTLDDIIDQECEDVLHAASQGRWRKANTYSYDGARKAVEGWLLATGWRVRAAPGAHAAVGEVVSLWLEAAPAPGPRIASTFGASRKARHDDEYPSPMARERTAAELRALALDNVRLINLARVQVGLDERPDSLPTETNLRYRT